MIETLLTNAAELLKDHPGLIALALVVGMVCGWPWIRKSFREISDADAIRAAGYALRAELGGLLDKEQARVATLTTSLDEASQQVRNMRVENGGLRVDIADLRREVRAMVRMCKSMRASMKRAVETNDVSGLKWWLDENPDDCEPPTEGDRPAAA